MSNVQSAVQQLSQQNYNGLFALIQSGRSYKLLALLALLREGHMSDAQVRKVLSMSNSAYATLRSRLYKKVIDHLLDKHGNVNVDTKDKD